MLCIAILDGTSHGNFRQKTIFSKCHTLYLALHIYFYIPDCNKKDATGNIPNNVYIFYGAGGGT